MGRVCNSPGTRKGGKGCSPYEMSYFPSLLIHLYERGNYSSQNLILAYLQPIWNTYSGGVRSHKLIWSYIMNRLFRKRLRSEVERTQCYSKKFNNNKSKTRDLFIYPTYRVTIIHSICCRARTSTFIISRSSSYVKVTSIFDPFDTQEVTFLFCDLVTSFSSTNTLTEKNYLQRH